MLCSINEHKKGFKYFLQSKKKGIPKKWMG